MCHPRWQLKRNFIETSTERMRNMWQSSHAVLAGVRLKLWKLAGSWRVWNADSSLENCGSMLAINQLTESQVCWKLQRFLFWAHFLWSGDEANRGNSKQFWKSVTFLPLTQISLRHKCALDDAGHGAVSKRGPTSEVKNIEQTVENQCSSIRRHP